MTMPDKKMLPGKTKPQTRDLLINYLKLMQRRGN